MRIGSTEYYGIAPRLMLPTDQEVRAKRKAALQAHMALVNKTFRTQAAAEKAMTSIPDHDREWFTVTSFRRGSL